MNKYLKYSDKQLERLINGVYNGKITRENLPLDLYEATVARLSKAVFKGFGGDFTTLAGEHEATDLLLYFQHNTAYFSAAKTFQQVNDMSTKLFDESGDKVPFADFKAAATEVFEEYNENWLRAEYNTAISQAQAGREWQTIQSNKDVLPLLQYQTVGDDRVRDEHADWDGVTLPVDHEFWETHLPPNGFNCRCIVQQLEADEAEQTDLTDSQETDPPSLFAMNSGTDRVIFKEDHPYFNVADKYEILKKQDFGLPVPPDPFIINKK